MVPEIGKEVEIRFGQPRSWTSVKLKMTLVFLKNDLQSCTEGSPSKGPPSKGQGSPSKGLYFFENKFRRQVRDGSRQVRDGFQQKINMAPSKGRFSKQQTVLYLATPLYRFSILDSDID